MKSTIWLMGGLGNQLFQFNYGSYLKSIGYSVVYSDYLTKRNFSTRLLNWKIHEFCPIEDQDIVSIKPLTAVGVTLLAKAPLLNHVSNFYRASEIKPKSLNIFGYFQDFFEVIDSNSFLSMKPMRRESSIVCHLRMTDTLWNKEYTSRIIREFLDYPSSIDMKKIVVTDHPELARNMFSSDITVVKRSVKEDFDLMRAASVLFLSNSTFSFWAAKLGSNQMIYAPKTPLFEYGLKSLNIEKLRFYDDV
ncbi:hypothetical protein N9I36_01165 [Planktomarina temperata]|nr:hypothetical protein [Planktomarina temperata]